jgi:hypothetical protein
MDIDERTQYVFKVRRVRRGILIIPDHIPHEEKQCVTDREMASVHYWDTDIRDLGHSKNDGRGSYAAIGSGSVFRGRRPSAS